MYEQIVKSKDDKRTAIPNYIGQNKRNMPKGFVFGDNRLKMITQLKSKEIMRNACNKYRVRQYVENQIQCAINGITSWEEFVKEYQNRNNGDSPAKELKSSVQAVIREAHVYSFDEAFERAMELALLENKAEIETTDVFVRVQDLIPQLDSEQHKPGLVTYDHKTGAITQTPVVESSATLLYGQSRLEDIRNVQSSDKITRQAIVSIFFEILDENKDIPITTGDGRHRIAVYSAMGIPWIRASVTAKQRAILAGRGINVQDQPSSQ